MRGSAVLGVDALQAERRRFVATIESLSDEQFESGRTLCEQWAPRDVLAHLVGTDHVSRYLRYGGHVNKANAAIVADARRLSRAELTRAGHDWAERPSLTSRVSARALLGDVAVHHQDVLRGLGRSRDVPPQIAGAIFREGVLLSTGTRRNLLRYRVEPTTPGAVALGRGRRVRGTAEALGLWLGGRRGLEGELEFS